MRAGRQAHVEGEAREAVLAVGRQAAGRGALACQPIGGFLHFLREIAQQALKLLRGLALEGHHDGEIETVDAAQGLHMPAHPRFGHIAGARIEGGHAVVSDEPAEAGADDGQPRFGRG